MKDIEQIVDDQIDQIESQVAHENRAEDHAWREGRLPVIDDLDEETVEEMWKATAAYTEEYVAKAFHVEPSEGVKRRWAELERAFRRNPRSYHVADCEKCDWVMGGWLTKANADNALRSHRAAKKH